VESNDLRSRKEEMRVLCLFAPKRRSRSNRKLYFKATRRIRSHPAPVLCVVGSGEGAFGLRPQGARIRGGSGSGSPERNVNVSVSRNVQADELSSLRLPQAGAIYLGAFPGLIAIDGDSTVGGFHLDG
jgi:hypothetical protein